MSLPPAAQFCVDQAPASQSHRTVFIATVPDPELTHLSLTFDRYIESITWGVADGDLDGQRYSLTGYWFPWRADLKQPTDAGGLKAAEDDRDKRVNTPGLLLFRQRTDPLHQRTDPQSLLLVFLVGETPTSGVNRVAFQKAWNYATSSLATDNLPICPPGSCVGILGPSFTGSLPSLSLLLQQQSAPTNTFVISTITGAPADPLPALNAHFCSTAERGDNTRQAFLSYLANLTTLGTAPRPLSDISGQLAYLVEDETGYGEAITTDALVLRYPRGIARIRNSSQELPGIATPPAQNTGYPELPLNIRDTGQDSIPSFSQQQTPVSQEAVLIDLASTLRREHMKYLGIIATDPLDALFLSRAIRSLDPDIRIILFHSDLLFERAARTWGLHGILAITSYPLISRAQYYVRAHPPRRTQFASDSAEGEYNACRRLLLPPSVNRAARAAGRPDPLCDSSVDQKSDSPGDYLLDYASPFPDRGHSTHRPSAWVTVLGRDSWWPVAALDSGSTSALLNGPNPAAHSTEHFSAEVAPELWFLFFWIVWTACCAHAVLILCMNTGSTHLESLWQRTFLRVFGWGFKPGLMPRRRALLAAASLIVSALCWALAAAAYTSGAIAESRNVQVAAAVALSVIAALEALWAAGPTYAVAPVIFCVVLEIVGVHSLLITEASAVATGHTLAFSGYRAVHLESGTSPLLPPVLLLFALYFYLWLRLAQLRNMEDRHSTLPPAAEMRLSADATNIERIEIGPWALAVTIGGAASWLVFYNPYSAMGGVEGRFYDLVLTALSSAVVALLVLTIMRFLSAWLVIRKILRALERHPNRYAFSRLPKDFSWTAIWSGDPRPKLLMPMRSLDVLRMIPETQPKVSAVETELAWLSSPNSRFQDSYTHVDSLYAELNEAAVLIAQALAPIWDRGVSDSIASREKRDEVPDAWVQDPIPIARQEFIALRYVAFIRYALLQMRAFLASLTYMFILLVAAFTVYPFDGPRKIGIALVTLFLIIGAGAISAFAQMDRDPLLSRLSETKPNQLSRNFVYRLLSFGALPLLTLLASQVPEVGNLLLSWAQPALQALK